MAGLYIHIPFCKSRCIYCGFYSTTAIKLRQQYVNAVVKEMKTRNGSIATIYLGGGTPSQLTTDQLRQLLEAAYIYNKVEANAEVTVEVNPDDVTEQFAYELGHMAVNRVSMGVQTFCDERLRFLHRRHTAAQVMTAIERLRKAGIRNISIDLMYGFPGETLANWESDIDMARSLGAEHLSAYCLMVEEGTPLYQMRSQHENFKALFPDEELERQMYELLIDKLEEYGYEHYEISNFARPGFRSRHNTSYWNGTPYIGLGAAAHSYDGACCRRWNVADIQQYIKAIEDGHPCYEEEHLDENTRYNDVITVTLRTRDGLDLTTLSDKHRDYCLKNAQRFIDGHLLTFSNDHLILTRRGLFVSDMVMSELMLV